MSKKKPNFWLDLGGVCLQSESPVIYWKEVWIHMKGLSLCLRIGVERGWGLPMLSAWPQALTLSLLPGSHLALDTWVQSSWALVPAHLLGIMGKCCHSPSLYMWTIHQLSFSSYRNGMRQNLIIFWHCLMENVRSVYKIHSPEE